MWYPKHTMRFEVRGKGFTPFFTEDRAEAHFKAKAWSEFVNSFIYVNDVEEGTTTVWSHGHIVGRWGNHNI